MEARDVAGDAYLSVLLHAVHEDGKGTRLELLLLVLVLLHREERLLLVADARHC